MKMLQIMSRPLIAIITAFVIAPASARDFASVKSSYLGDGWYSYHVRMEPNPFFSTQIMGLAGAQYFTNRIDNNTPPVGWTQDATTNKFIWNKNDQTEAHPLPYEFTMMARSSSMGFRTEANFYIAFQLWINGWLQSPILSQNIAGYVRLPALVPCDPSESDGSPTELFSSSELFPDPQVVRMDGYSLSYSWPNSNTVIIEASRDLQSWSNIVQTVGYGGTTTWHSAQEMDAFGSCFRVGLVAMRALTNNVASLHYLRQASPISTFKRFTPEGLLVSRTDGDLLIPAGQTNCNIWYLPVTQPP